MSQERQKRRQANGSHKREDNNTSLNTNSAQDIGSAPTAKPQPLSMFSSLREFMEREMDGKSTTLEKPSSKRKTDWFTETHELPSQTISSSHDSPGPKRRRTDHMQTQASCSSNETVKGAQDSLHDQSGKRNIAAADCHADRKSLDDLSEDEEGTLPYVSDQVSAVNENLHDLWKDVERRFDEVESKIDRRYLKVKSAIAQLKASQDEDFQALRESLAWFQRIVLERSGSSAWPGPVVISTPTPLQYPEKPVFVGQASPPAPAGYLGQAPPLPPQYRPPYPHQLPQGFVRIDVETTTTTSVSSRSR